MSCPSITCMCSRCTQIRRHAYREGLADAHRVFNRTARVQQPTVQVSPSVLALLLPRLYELEWSGKRELLGGVVSAGCCPECESNEARQEHLLWCGLGELISMARVATVQPDLFGVGR